MSDSFVLTSLRDLIEIEKLGPVTTRFGPHIVGVEVTQAIQYYGSDEHLTDPADRGPDNSIGYVADKPAWVRVYVTPGLFARSAGALVTGRLTIHRRGRLPFQWDTGATLTPQSPGSVSLQRLTYAEQRRTTGATLNFCLPASEMRGEMRLDLELRYVADDALFGTTSVDVDATRCQTLTLRGIPVTYNGTNGANPPQNITINPPTLAQLTTTAAWTLTVWPVASTPSLSFTAGITLTVPLTGAPTVPGGCSQGWLTLNGQLAQARTADGNRANTIYYGLLPSGVPMGPVIGCGGGGLGSGTVGDQVTMTHEAGHALGHAHSPCVGVNNGADPNYPAYEPYDTTTARSGWIGEYGLDINNGVVHRPDVDHCYMTYCGPRWVSLFNYRRMIDHAMLRPRRCHVPRFDFWDWVIADPFLFPPEYIPDPPPNWDRVKELPVKYDIDPVAVISVIGVVVDGKVEVQHVNRVAARLDMPGARRTTMRAELLLGEDKVAASVPVFRLAKQGCGCGGGAQLGHGDASGEGCACGGDVDEKNGSYVFQALIPDVDTGAALRLTRDDVELARIVAPASPPKPPKVEAEVGDGRVTVRWSEGRVAKTATRDYWVRWSDDDGHTWTAVQLGLTERSLEIDSSTLPAGPVLLDVVAHDGFHSVPSEPIAIEVPPAAPTAAIMYPYDGSRLLGGQTMRLWGSVLGNTPDVSDRHEAVWLIDGNEVARGLDVYVDVPREGEHEVRLVVRSEHGESDAAVRILTF